MAELCRLVATSCPGSPGGDGLVIPDEPHDQAIGVDVVSGVLRAFPGDPAALGGRYASLGGAKSD